MSKLRLLAGDAIASPMPSENDVQIGSKVYKVRNLEDVEEREDVWIWNGFILADNINLIQGHGEAGKGWISLDIAARITRGGRFPNFVDSSKDMPLGEGKKVLFLTSEDDYGKTVKKRFRMLGGDPKKLDFIECVADADDPEKKHPFSMQSVDALEALVEKHKYCLIVFDPVQSYLGPGAKSNDQESVRPILEGLRKIAFKYNCGILLSMHVGKSKATDAVLRGIGTVDFRNAARSVIMVGEFKKKRLIKQTKANYLKEDIKDLAFEFVLDDGLTWLSEPVKGLTATALLDLGDEKEGDRSKLEEAEEFLLELLEEESYLGVVVAKLAKEAGISKDTLDRAKKNLQIGHKRLRIGNKWQYYWHLAKYRIRTNDDGTEVIQELV